MPTGYFSLSPPTVDRLWGRLLSSLALPLWIHPCGCSFAQEPWLTLVTPIPLSLGRWYWWLPTLLISRLTQCPPFGFSALPCPAKQIPVFKPPCFQYFGGFYFLGEALPDTLTNQSSSLHPNIPGSGTPYFPIRAVCFISKAGPLEGNR